VKLTGYQHLHTEFREVERPIGSDAAATDQADTLDRKE
jgi:hypothetical protein